MATLTVTESTDYSATSLTNIDIVDFVNMDQAAEAKFASSQFSNWPLYRDILFDGSEDSLPNHTFANSFMQLEMSIGAATTSTRRTGA